MGLSVNQGRNYRGPFTATLDVAHRMAIPVRHFGGDAGVKECGALAPDSSWGVYQSDGQWEGVWGSSPSRPLGGSAKRGGW